MAKIYKCADGRDCARERPPPPPRPRPPRLGPRDLNRHLILSVRDGEFHAADCEPEIVIRSM